MKKYLTATMVDAITAKPVDALTEEEVSQLRIILENRRISDIVERPGNNEPFAMKNSDRFY